MKTLELQNFRLSELSKEESNRIDGGFIWIPMTLGVALIISAINNFGDIRQGLMDGYQGTSRY